MIIFNSYSWKGLVTVHVFSALNCRLCVQLISSASYIGSKFTQAELISWINNFNYTCIGLIVIWGADSYKNYQNVLKCHTASFRVLQKNTLFLLKFRHKILNNQNLVEIFVTSSNQWLIPNTPQFHWIMHCQRFEQGVH